MMWLFWIGLIVIILIAARRRLLITEAFFAVLASKLGQCSLYDMYEPMRLILGREVNPGTLRALADKLEEKGHIHTWIVDGDEKRNYRPDRMVRIVNTWEQI